MLKALFVTISMFSFFTFADVINPMPFGAVIKNKKNGQMIVARCNWLMDDKQSGKLVCKDYRLFLVDDSHSEIRELTKIKMHDPNVNDDFFPSDEYVRSNLDFAKIMITKMTKKELTGTTRDHLITGMENYYRSLGSYSVNRNISIHKTVGKYLLHFPAVLISYPFFAVVQGIDKLHANYYFPKKVKKHSSHLYESLKLVLTRHNESVIKMKNKDFNFVLSILEN